MIRRATPAGLVQVLGFHSKPGIKPVLRNGSYTVLAKINQDRGVLTYPLCGNREQLLLAVYDGHGEHGEICSEFCGSALAIRIVALVAIRSVARSWPCPAPC